jgi:hypothetical protein
MLLRIAFGFILSRLERNTSCYRREMKGFAEMVPSGQAGVFKSLRTAFH